MPPSIHEPNIAGNDCQMPMPQRDAPAHRHGTRLATIAAMFTGHAGDARAVFLDKDGTLIWPTVHGADVGRIELLPGVGEGLRLLQDAGYLLIVASNEPGVATGRFP